MIALTEYAKIIGRNSNTIGGTIRASKKLKNALEGHLSYGKAANGYGRALYLDEIAVDVLDKHYGISNEEKVPVPVHTAVKTKKKSSTTPYKRKYDEVQKKLLKAMETQDALRVEIDSLRVELVNAKDEIISLHNRKLWQRIVN